METGDYLLLESGDKIILDELAIVPPVVEVPSVSISHTTLDAGVDLRKYPKERKPQRLSLTVEIPVKGVSSVAISKKTEAIGYAKKVNEKRVNTKGGSYQKMFSPFAVSGMSSSSQNTSVHAKGKKSYAEQIEKLRDYLESL